MTIDKHVLVGVDMNQKSDGEIELAPGRRIYINRDFGFDGKHTKPSLAVVIEGYEDLKEGDVVLCHHVSFNRELNEDGDLFGDTGKKQGDLSIFRLEYSMIYVKLDQDGNPYPLKNVVIAERLDKDYRTSLVIADSVKKTDDNTFRVIKGCDGVEDGIEIICHKYSDYAMEYSWNSKERSIIRIKKEDILFKKYNMKLEGINGNLLIKVDEVEKKTAGGIILPDTANLKPNMGTILVADEGTIEKPMRLESGWKIIFNKGTGTEIELFGEKYLVLNESQVLFFDRNKSVPVL